MDEQKGSQMQNINGLDWKMQMSENERKNNVLLGYTHIIIILKYKYKNISDVWIKYLVKKLS